jgi:hypothetical protein
MKNFSAKTANFQNLKVKDANVISEVNLGTAPNQIPLNKDLGSLAYQDAVNLDDVSADMVELRAIAAEISDSAVDVFVYDTSRDSDGGKWRERTQHTSWYNEELNTATRGARREFPAVAVIVAEVNKVTIYDGDDPDMGMWMVFEVDVSQGFNILASGSDLVLSVDFLNGIICVGMDSGGLVSCNFISESIRYYRLIESSFTGGYYQGVIADRNSHKGYRGNYNETALINDNVNDVAMTVLPNAPIDENTGLPVPTIAVATDGGVSVIKDDGSVVDIVYTNQTIESLWLKQNRIWIAPGNGSLIVGDIPNTDKSSGTASGLSSLINGWNAFANTNETLSTLGSTNTLTHGGVFGSDQGLNLIYEEKSNPASSLVAYTTSKYNTGWMPGDIKLAALSDTTVETIGTDSSELVTNGDFSTDSDWEKGTGWSISGGVASCDGTNYATLIQDNVFSVFGVKYVITFTVSSYTSGDIEARWYDTDWRTIGSAVSGDGTYTFTFTLGENSNGSLTFRSGSFDGSIDNMSVRATTELITNGDFSNGDDGSWTDYSAANLTTSEISIEQSYLGNNSWKFVSSLANSGISQSHGVYTEKGKTYTLSGYVYSSTGKLWLRWRNGNDGGYIVDNYELVSGTPNTWLAFSVTAKETSSGSLGGIRLVANAAGTFYVDGLSIRPAEEDRSVNDNGLQIVGEIQKTPVAPGADLVAYSGFSANDYLVQPYNADLDFGTGDFCVMGWFKQSPTTNFHNYLSRGGRINVYVDAATSLLNFRVTDGTIFMNCLSTSVIDNDTWTFFVGVKSDGTTYNYINGKLEQTANYRQVGSLDGEFITHIGRSHDPSDPRPADTLALWRISATAPTPEQIAKIYRDEKPLFQQGAQATLYGTSDAVTALAYDQKTELLHVGTSAGRSDFSGLSRVHQTNSPVTTCIDAEDGLIAEN